MVKRLALILFLCYVTLCLHAVVWVPITSSADLHVGDSVVIAIQNGRSTSVWYALNANASITANTQSVTVSGGVLLSPPSVVIWHVASISPFRFEQGSTTPLGTTADWILTQLGTTNRFRFMSSAASNDTLIWRSNKSGHGIDWYSVSKGDRLSFDQVDIHSNLTTGAFAFTIFRPLPVAVFDAGEYGYLNSADSSKIADKSTWQVIVPGCFTYSAAHPFMGWTDEEGGTVVKYTAGSVITIHSDKTFYAVYDYKEVPTQCFDFSNLYADYVKCYAGSNTDTYLRPIAGTRAVTRYDYEWVEGVFTGDDLSSYDVHINVCTDPNATCILLTDQVKEIPDGFTKSIRLGNFQRGELYTRSFAEAVDYTIVVDSTRNPLLIFKYLPIMEDSHGGGSGVRFSIYDEKGEEINPECVAFNFSLEGSTISGTMPGAPQWKSTPQNPAYKQYNNGNGGPFQYHDWATLGLDLSRYHGQTIVLRIFLHDCLWSGHFGVLYYAMQCAEKKISVYSCGAGSEALEMSAPAGFFYRWYSESSPSDILSTTRTLHVPEGGTDSLFYCDLSVDVAFSCKFTISAKVEPRYPVADFDYELRRGFCADTVIIRNTSFASPDGVIEFDPHQDCDSAIWNFSGGRLLNGSLPDTRKYDFYDTLIYTTSGDKTISLKVCLKDWECAVDEKQINFHVYSGDDYQITYDTICLGESFVFWGDTLTPTRKGSQTYMSRVKADCFIDSITLEEHLFVRDKYEIHEYDTLCHGEVKDWHGHLYDTTGVYYDSLFTAIGGCDSVHVLHLDYFNEPDSVYIRATICEGETYWWNDVPLISTGIYSDHFINTHGCDSFVVLDLYVRPRYGTNVVLPHSWDNPYYQYSTTDDPNAPWWSEPYIEDTINQIGDPDFWVAPYWDIPIERDTICEGESFLWHGRYYTDMGLYDDTLQTIYGCDSIVYLYLHVCPRYEYSEAHVIWQGQSFTWYDHRHDTVIRDAGIYYDSLLTSSCGCDSVYILELIVNTKDKVTVFDTICEGDSLLWHYNLRDTVYYKEGVYEDTLKDSDGIDSIVILRLTVLPRLYAPPVSDYICDGDSILWQGRYYYSADTYYDTLTSTITGCDSILSLILSVRTPFLSLTIDTVCEGQTYKWFANANTYTSTIKDTLAYTDRFGCDSTYILDLFVQPTIHRYDTIALGCGIDSVFWYGKYIKADADYSKVLTSTVTFCDSIRHLHLFHITGRDSTVYDTVCLDAYYRGVLYPDTGSFIITDTLDNYGCDSVVHTRLRVRCCDIDSSLTYDTVCTNATYYWHHLSLSTSGDYRDTILSQRGCDSICKLHLVVRDEVAYIIDLYDTICEGETYDWAGMSLTATGTYTDRSVASTGCDSMVYLHLTVYNNYDASFVSDPDFWVAPYWNMEQILSDPGFWVEPYKPVTLPEDRDPDFWVAPYWQTFYRHDTICDNEPYIHTGKYYTASGSYTDTLKTIHGCDSVIYFDLTVFPHNDSLYTDSLCSGDTIRWRAHEITHIGLYADTLTNVFGCDSILSLSVSYKSDCNPCPPVADSTYTHAIIQPDELPYLWAEHTLTTDTLITDYFKTALDCDSISTLRLHILEPCEMPTQIKYGLKTQ